MTLLELAKEILFKEIKEHNQYWTLKRKVMYKVKQNRKK